MKRTLSIAACATAMLAAAKLVALPIDNRVTPDGTPVLIPAVQQYQARKGTLALPAASASSNSPITASPSRPRAIRSRSTTTAWSSGAATCAGFTTVYGRSKICCGI